MMIIWCCSVIIVLRSCLVIFSYFRYQSIVIGPELSSSNARSSRLLSALRLVFLKFPRAESGERGHLQVIGSSELPEGALGPIVGSRDYTCRV